MVGGKVLISAAKLIISISVPKLQTTAYVSRLIVLEKKKGNTFSYPVLYISKSFIRLGKIFNSLRNLLFLIKIHLFGPVLFFFYLKTRNMYEHLFQILLHFFTTYLLLQSALI